MGTSVAGPGSGFAEVRQRLVLENVSLPHPLAVLRSSVERPRIQHSDRRPWILLTKSLGGWKAKRGSGTFRRRWKGCSSLPSWEGLDSSSGFSFLEFTTGQMVLS